MKNGVWFFLLFFLPSILFGQSYNFEECHIKGTPAFIKLPCTYGCISDLCIMQAECEMGAGPFVVELTCAATSEGMCPSLVNCAKDKRVIYKRSIDRNSLYTPSSQNSFGSGSQSK